MTIEELAPKIEQKKISPVELIQAYLNQIETTEPCINAYISVLADNANEQAKREEQDIMNGNYKGVLHGIPYSAKDLIFTKGIKTTAGSKVLKNHIPFYDATVIKKLTQAGAILIGKNNTHEFAYGGTNENEFSGPCKNPWDTTMISGGSSGGSASSVAGSSSVFSIGTDTGGSIRVPAAMCGIVGIKGTYGRVSKYGVIPLSNTLDHVGPLTKSTWDAAAVLEVIAGYDKNDPFSVATEVPVYTKELGKNSEKMVKGLRIGIIEEFFFEGVDKQIETTVRETIKQLEKWGATAVNLEFPNLNIEFERTLNPILAAEAYAYHKDTYTHRPLDYGKDVRNRLEAGSHISASDYIQAQNRRLEFQREWTKLYEHADVFIAPTTAVPAYPIDGKKILINDKLINPHKLGVSAKTSPPNINGFPAISIPCGYMKSGLPIGLQIQAAPFQEEKLLRIANLVEKVISEKVGERKVLIGN